jgi:hypothetical protein
MQQSTQEIIVGQARRVFDLASRNEELVIEPLRDATAELQATLAEAAREERAEAS